MSGAIQAKHFYVDPAIDVPARLHKKSELNQKVGIYSLELFRQIAAAVAAGLFIVGSGIGSAIASAIAPLVLCITGPVTVKVAAEHLHEVDVAVKAAQQQVDSASEKEMPEAKEALHLAKWGQHNQRLFLAMGFARIGSGALFACETIEKLSKLHMLVSGFVLKAGVAVAFVALHLVANSIYALRGAVLTYYAQKNLDLINPFSVEFSDKLSSDPKSAMAFMVEAEKKGDRYLGQRLDLDYLELKAENCTDPNTYLKQVHKAIASQKLKQEILRRSGALMILGALLGTAALIAGTGGIAGIVLSIGAAVAFATAEVHFIRAYNKKHFAKHFDKVYKPPVPINWNSEPQLQVAPTEERVARQSCCPKFQQILTYLWIPLSQTARL